MKRWAERQMARRAPDFVIGGADNAYLRRWWVIPRNRWFNVYLHEILRSDDDRALHDHPWINLSILIDGGYFEHTIAAGGIHRRVWRGAGAWKFRWPSAAHRLELAGDDDRAWVPDHDEPEKRAVSLFITGPNVRSWGFHCPEAGWVHWRDFTAGDNGEIVGRGCGEP